MEDVSLCYVLLQADGSDYVLRIDDEHVGTVCEDAEEMTEKDGVILAVHVRVVETFFREKIAFPAPVVCIRFVAESGVHELQQAGDVFFGDVRLQEWGELIGDRFFQFGGGEGTGVDIQWAGRIGVVESDQVFVQGESEPACRVRKGEFFIFDGVCAEAGILTQTEIADPGGIREIEGVGADVFFCRPVVHHIVGNAAELLEIAVIYCCGEGQKQGETFVLRIAYFTFVSGLGQHKKVKEDFFVAGRCRENPSGQPADQLVIAPAVEVPVFGYQLAFGNELRKVAPVEMQPGLSDALFRNFFQAEDGCPGNFEIQGETIKRSGIAVLRCGRGEGRPGQESAGRLEVVWLARCTGFVFLPFLFQFFSENRIQAVAHPFQGQEAAVAVLSENAVEAVAVLPELPVFVLPEPVECCFFLPSVGVETLLCLGKAGKEQNRKDNPQDSGFSHCESFFFTGRRVSLV
ncbi:MAG: hypothetical protein ACLTSL_01215 [Odoribacter splanchnicus]